jgi:hypothetical protein
MSGKPYPDGVKRVRELLNDEARLRDEAARLKRSIEEAKKRLETVDGEYGRACSERTKLMAQMDLTSSGNYGYEQRMSWFLVELVRQTKEAAPERVVYAVDAK